MPVVVVNLALLNPRVPRSDKYHLLDIMMVDREYRKKRVYREGRIQTWTLLGCITKVLVGVQVKNFCLLFGRQKGSIFALAHLVCILYELLDSIVGAC